MYKRNVTETVPTFSSQFVNNVAFAPIVACSVVCKTCSTVAFWATWFFTQHSVIILLNKKKDGQRSKPCLNIHYNRPSIRPRWLAFVKHEEARGYLTLFYIICYLHLFKVGWSTRQDFFLSGRNKYHYFL